MKIALCLEFPLGLRGGVSVLVEALAEGLRKHHELVLVSPDTRQTLTVAGAQSLFNDIVTWQPEKVTAATSQSLARKLNHLGVQVAHFHTAAFGWGNRVPGACPFPYVKRSGIRVCTTVHLVGDWLDGFCGSSKPLLVKLALWPPATIGKLHALASVDWEIAVSQHDCAILRRRYWPLRSRFLQIYHSRVRVNEADPNSAVRKKIVLCVGHIARRKGQAVLAGAFRQIAPEFPDWELWLVGPTVSKSEWDEVKQIVTSSPASAQMRLLGERMDASSLMAEASIYVQPSLVEPLGLALQEAMLAGCACIGSRVGGIPELIASESEGILVEPDDSTALAKVLRKLMESPETCRKLGDTAHRSMAGRGMNWENMIQQHEALYEGMLRRD